MQMNDVEKQLYIKMVEMFVGHYPDTKKTDEDRAYFDALGCTAFSKMRSNLIALGFAEGTPNCSSLTTNEEGARQSLTRQFLGSAPPFDEVLNNWMYLFSSYPNQNTTVIPSTREEFNVDAMYSDIMRLFVYLGYAKTEGDKFSWTEKIGPVMRSFHQWTSELEDLGDLEEQEIQRALAALTQRMENRLREAGNAFDMIRHIEEYWDGQAWVEEPLPPSKQNASSSFRIGLLKSILQKLKQD